MCGRYIGVRWYKKHLEKHYTKEEDIYKGRYHHAVVVDDANGIYCVAKRVAGPQYPLHVKKVTSGSGAVSFCEEIQKAAKRGGNVAYECTHLRSIRYALVTSTPSLNDETLDELVGAKYLKEERGTAVKQIRDQAFERNTPLIVLVPEKEKEGHEKSKYFFSVSDVANYYSPILRTVVTLNPKTQELNCVYCRLRRGCVHNNVAKCFLFQGKRDEIRRREVVDDDNDAKDTEKDTKEMPSFLIESEGDNTASSTSSSSSADAVYPPTDSMMLRKMKNYISEHKNYPTKLDSVEIGSKIRVKLIPTEQRCYSCNGHLSEAQLVTKKGKIVRRDEIIHGM